MAMAKEIFNQKKSELYKKTVGILLFLFTIAVLGEVIQGYLFETKTLYAVSVGPVLEEALKGGVLLLFFMAMSLSSPDFKKRLSSKEAWLVGGALTGLLIGLLEDWIDYSLSLSRLVPTLNHMVWTSLVGLGIFLYIKSEEKRSLDKIAIPYTIAVVSHVLWNYHAYLIGMGRQDIVFGALPWIISIGAIGIIWRTTSDQKIGSSR
ncbi:hypothetical protein AKJ43_00295 [candidate division MSBL1 archaeon SCGC-AAA261D19]|uniref:Protease PrsW n=1 Tax=candidate division MSBL1 archaeon SCGC-AAA261D19 TaxID=1698273 RepID=A0A133V8S2_9EURY|nr:hypothetical protein AKJ43_00295 [candidate division MSBL1 archaeon SCGC-AAA261D19]